MINLIKSLATSLLRSLKPASAARGRSLSELAFSGIVYLISIGIGLGIGAIPVIVMGKDPVKAYWTLFHASLGGIPQIAETLVKTIPLWLTGLGISLAFSVGFWNIGGEGQFYLGAIAATGIGISIASLHLPQPIALFLVMAAGIIGGASWALIPAFLKVFQGINEIIVTVMMNFIAILLSEYLILGPWRDPAAPEPMTLPIATESILPKLVPRTWLHAGLFIAIAATVVAHVIMKKTVLGYEIKCVGANPVAAKWSGIDISRVTIYSMLLAGGLIGLAGASEIAGIHYRLLRGISPGYGALAIIIALLAKYEPVGVAIASFFFAALLVGADALQRTINMPVSAVYVIEATILLSTYILQNVLRRGLRA